MVFEAVRGEGEAEEISSVLKERTFGFFHHQEYGLIYVVVCYGLKYTIIVRPANAMLINHRRARLQ